jgi:DNA invertase Pin-like site-specific DNA recombinase
MRMRAALYLRVSTDEQTTERQERELREVAKARGWEVVETYADNGISGSKSREQRPAFDRLHQDATRRRFDIVMTWSVDRLGRSLQDLLSFLSELKAAAVELFLYQQAVDTTTPTGRAMFQMMGVFAEFERCMIVERVRSGMAKAKASGTKSGKAIGRPRVPELKRAAIKAAYAAGGISMRKLAAQFDVSLGMVQIALRED